MTAWETLESLGVFEKLERASERLGLPHLPEFELSDFRTLYRGEIAAALEETEAALAEGESAPLLARRGRLRRVAGDLLGALADFHRALDLEPGLAQARAFLAEADLTRPQALEGLARAGGFAWTGLWSAAARLSAGDAAGAKEDAAGFVRRLPRSALGWLLLGAALERLGRRREAHRAYARAWKAQPVCSAACLLASRTAATFKEELAWFNRAYDVSPVLGFITLQIHQTTRIDAPAYVRKVRRFCFDDPATVGAYYRREATQSHFSHFPAEDYAFVSKLVAAHPRLAWVQAFYGRAACYTKDGAPEGVRHLSRAVALCPHAGWLRAWRANARRAAGDPEGAMRDFDDAARLQPFYHRAFVWRGGLRRKVGRVPEALEDLDRALAMDPHYSLTYYERSLARRAAGDLSGAAFDLDRAFLLDHRYHWAFKTGGPPSPADLEAAGRQLTRAIAAQPTVPSLWAWRGRLALQRDDVSAALLDLERACELDPHHALAHGWTGLSLLRSGRPEKAAERLARALELEPRFWIARLWLARALRACGRKARSRAVLAETLRLKATTPWAHCELAAFAREDGRLAEAERQLDRALLLDGKYPDAYLLLARVRLQRGRPARALEAARRCVEIAGNLGRAYVVRAAVYQALGRPEDALADYRRVLCDFPHLLNAEQRSAAEALLAQAR